MQTVTLKDVAQRANVSIGTASKVLSGDLRVKEENRRAVLDAVEKLGYNVNKVARSLAHKPVRIGVLLPTVFQAYYQPLLQGIQNVTNSLSDYKFSAIYETYSSFRDDSRVIECLRRFKEERVNGVVLGPSHVGTYSSEIADLHKLGIPVVLVSSDLEKSGRLACIRIDAEASGKIAADFAHAILRDMESATVLVGSLDVTEHSRKAESFCGRAQKLGLAIEGVFETRDEMDTAYAITRKILRERPNLRVIYVATANSLAVCRCIHDMGLSGKVRVITTDVLPELLPYIHDGTIVATLDQHLEQQGTAAVQTLYKYLSEGVLEKEGTRIAPSLLLQSGMLERLRDADSMQK